ncbi:MAG: c-type cytochrome domain-containing protein [Saprospiraceae bacterium]
MSGGKKKIAQYILASILLAGLAILCLPSCVHEPTITPDDNPIDTTGNPDDTTGNPVDTSTATPCDSNLIYFTSDVLPILISNCAKSGCHDVTTHKKDIVLDNFEHVIGSNIIKPYDINGSKLMEYITTSKSDDVMPPPPAQRLATKQILILSKWILQGAKDTTCNFVPNQCAITNVSYAGFVAPLLSTYCVGCHSGGAPSGGISLNTYTSVKAIAQSGRLYGAISWTTIYKMPKGGAKLPQCNIDKIKGWIDEGANNN